MSKQKKKKNEPEAPVRLIGIAVNPERQSMTMIVEVGKKPSILLRSGANAPKALQILMTEEEEEIVMQAFNTVGARLAASMKKDVSSGEKEEPSKLIL